VQSVRSNLSWADVLLCLKCILHLTSLSAPQRCSGAVQRLLSQGLLPASLAVNAWGAIQAPTQPLLREVQCALLDTWVQLLA
jgi:hypothetical protein